MTDKYLGKIILKQIFKGTNSYAYWMKRYISPKEFYGLRNTTYISQNIEEFLIQIKSIISKYISNITLKEVEMLLQKFNRFGLSIKVYQAFMSNSKVSKRNSLNQIKFAIFCFRIIRSKKLSLKEKFNQNFNLENINLKIIAPVCPDYSNIKYGSDSYRYTFESLGSGIGIVAEKAIKNIREIKKLSKDLISENFNIEYFIYVGDFECSLDNCRRLKETKDSFIAKTKLSALKIQNEEFGIVSDVFTKIAGGLDTWKFLIKYIKHNQNLNTFDDLKKKYPHIKHENAILSRIALYRRWYGDNAKIKEIFFEQVIEYIAMGLTISNHFNEDAFILASDHKVMRSYYDLLCSNPLISASADY